ncbi:hypothetical protein OSB04_029977 [Centaurea solstitialis]|uniref:DNA topoisomerase (ATP-hydrolyzing) n=1 Tax=Centaurea solstitialis TaxID=347529 RepID=A0AA38W4H9_9ASTR|nr:hypothetical protein OSB04_029977 [Centaurea solstitialis]
MDTPSEKKSWKEIKKECTKLRRELTCERGRLTTISDKLVEAEANFDDEESNEKRSLIVVEGNSARTMVTRGLISCDLHEDYGVCALSANIPNALKLWPSLLKVPGFLMQLATPIVKAFNKKDDSLVQQFFSIPKYETWIAQDMNRPSKYRIKYYKGLGAFPKEEVFEIFYDINKNKTNFVWVDQEDDIAIKQALGSGLSRWRKRLVNDFKPRISLDAEQAIKPTIRYKDFVREDLTLYFRECVERYIPSVVDGLRLAQRKVLFCLFKRKLEPYEEMDVGVLSSDVFQYADYHHGDSSIKSVIIRMAQDIACKNNINLLCPCAEFGTRDMHGENHAQSRYLSTRLSHISRSIFLNADECILQFLRGQKGESIQPKYYLPVIPMILVNGVTQVGGPWKTVVPSYKPDDVIENLKGLLTGKKYKEMIPSYDGYKGKVVSEDVDKDKKKLIEQSYITKGAIERIGSKKVKIIEVPFGMLIKNLKENLDKSPFVEKYNICKGNDDHDDNDICFDVDMRLNCSEYTDEDLLESFRLSRTLALDMMTLMDAEGNIKTYKSVKEILMEFYHLRLQYYGERKKAIIKEHTDRMNNIEPKDSHKWKMRLEALISVSTEQLWYEDLLALEEKLKELRNIKTQKNEELIGKRKRK